MRREDKFGYAFLLAGIGMPILIITVFGEKFAAAVVGRICVSCALLMLVLGQLHRDAPKERSRMATVRLFALGGAFTGAFAGFLIGISWMILMRNIRTETPASTVRTPVPVI